MVDFLEGNKKTIKDIYEPTVDGGYRPWDVEWRDKYIYGTVKKSWEEMTPQERRKEISDAEWRDKYIYGRKEKSSGEMKPEERVGEIKAQASSIRNGFNYQKISRMNAQTFKHLGSVELWRTGCPNCGGGLPAPENRETVKCLYCGSDVSLHDLQKAVNLKAKLDNRSETRNNEAKLDYKAAKRNKNSSKGFDFVDLLILGIFLLGILCMAITYAF
jgi:hypothetical protein